MAVIHTLDSRDKVREALVFAKTVVEAGDQGRPHIEVLQRLIDDLLAQHHIEVARRLAHNPLDDKEL